MKRIAIEIERSEALKYMMNEITKLQGKVKILEDQIHVELVDQGVKMDRVSDKLDKIIPMLDLLLPRIQTIEEEVRNKRPWISAKEKVEILAKLKVIEEKWAKESE